MELIRKAYADVINVTLPNDPLNGTFSSLGSIYAVALNIVFATAVAITLVYIIVSGIKLATSEGDKMAIQSARKTLYYAIAGFFVAVGFRAIVEIIVNILTGSSGNLPNSVPNF